MLDLYFGNVFSVLTLVFVAGMAAFIPIAIHRRDRISKWGRLVALFILVGTAISAFSAMRDGYGTADGVFTMSSLQSAICSIAGGLIFLTGVVSLFLKKQALRRSSFFLISALFAVQVVTIEASRVVLALGGSL